MIKSIEELDRITAWQDNDGDLGEYRTQYHIFRMPEGETIEAMRDLFKDAWPAERCQHSYDCCANWYAGGVTVTLLPYDRFLVERTYSLNI